MIHRTARERLLFEAKDLPPDVLTLDGIRGHTARLEPSPMGQARLIRIFDGDAEVCWTFRTEAGEARPPFYPDDVPFLDGPSVTVMWDDETGLLVMWMLPSGQARMAKVLERMKGIDLADTPKGLAALGAEMQNATSEERKRLFQEMGEREGDDVRRWATGMFGDLIAEGFPDDAAAALESLVTFHEERGWTVGDGGKSEGPFRSVHMHRDSVERVLHATAFLGIANLGLHQKAG